MQPSSSADQRDVLRLAGTLGRLARILEHEVQTVREQDPLSLVELGVLGQIQRGLDLPSLVARELRLDPPRVTRLTDHLVALGYIVRTPDSTDRRLCRLQLTDTGLSRLEAGRRDVAQVMDSLLEGITPEEREALQRGLEAVRRVVSAGPGSAVESRR